MRRASTGFSAIFLDSSTSEAAIEAAPPPALGVALIIAGLLAFASDDFGAGAPFGVAFITANGTAGGAFSAAARTEPGGIDDVTLGFASMVACGAFDAAFGFAWSNDSLCSGAGSTAISSVNAASSEPWPTTEHSSAPSPCVSWYRRNETNAPTSGDPEPTMSPTCRKMVPLKRGWSTVSRGSTKPKPPFHDLTCPVIGVSLMRVRTPPVFFTSFCTGMLSTGTQPMAPRPLPSEYTKKLTWAPTPEITSSTSSCAKYTLPPCFVASGWLIGLWGWTQPNRPFHSMILPVTRPGTTWVRLPPEAEGVGEDMTTSSSASNVPSP
mmetsp:Transcript_57405/g.151088  ORF Transcript_57405/g.151088 Transcript_57405/m.151088 type:complete len:323 (-) Transcript_57405:61-1029(-)